MTLNHWKILMLLTSLAGYLEWGEQHLFLAEAEWMVIQKLFTHPADVLHPLILLPIWGQLMLLGSIRVRIQNRLVMYTVVGALSVLPLLMLVIGIMSKQWKISLSVVPFLWCTIAFLLQHHRAANSKA